jgi:hypothetical protein
MYLTLRSIPEIRHLPQPERRRLWYRAMRDDSRWATALVVALLVGSFYTAMKVLTPFVTTWLPIPVLAIAMWIIFYRLVFMMWAVRLRPLIRKQLGGDG